MNPGQNIYRLPDDLVVGEYLTPVQVLEQKALEQNVGWHEVDLELDKSFGRENEPRALIFIADTGLPNHVDIPKPVEAKNFTNDASVNDQNYHSTWINGCLTAYNNDIGYQGICPEDTPVAIAKVLNNQGSGWNMLAAMRWALEFWTTHPKRRSGEWVCAFYGMSYGGGGYSADEQKLFRDMVAAGIIPNASSGNESRSAPSYPAAYEAVYKCGAYDRNRDQASFTNYGPWTDFVAPGVNVPGPVGRNQWSLYSGTSMSRPITEGTLANFVSSRPDDKWVHNFHGLKEAVAPFMKNLPGTWDGDGVFLPAKATVRNKHFIF